MEPPAEETAALDAHGRPLPAAPPPSGGPSPIEHATVPGLAELLALGLDETVPGSGGAGGRPRFEAASWIGRLVGDYRIEAELGHGGMGAVFRATNTRVGSTVALKLLRFAPGESAERLRRFEFEARAAAQLNHPNIINVFDVGQVGDLYFLAMEYIEGQPLSALIERGPLEPQTAVRIMLDLCTALEFAHAQGVIHRDLKPSNILIEPSGRAQLMDFGLARSLRAPKRHTEAGIIMGTLHYMSPEQARGQSHEADRRSDIYGLGVVLYEMLTGKLPHRAETTFGLLERILAAEPVRPRRRRPGLERDLEVIVLKAMEKNPARRYGSAAALAEDLRRYLAGEAILAQPPTLVYRAQKLLQRHRFLTFSVASTLLSVLMVALGFLLHDWRLVARMRAEEQARLPRALLAQEAAELSDPEREAWRWFHALRLAGRPGEALAELNAHAPDQPTAAPKFRDEANRRLWLGVLLAQTGQEGARAQWDACRQWADVAHRPELAAAAAAYLDQPVPEPSGLAPEARAVLEYHRGHAAWLRGDTAAARAAFQRAVDSSVVPVESQCAAAELERLAAGP